MRRKLPPAVWILIAMLIGIAIGYMVFTSFPNKNTAAEIAGYISIMSDVFLRLIKDADRSAGVLHPGRRHRPHGRRGRRRARVRQGAGLVRHRLAGLAAARPVDGQPAAAGHDLGLPLPDIGAAANLATSKFTLKDFISHVVPTSLRRGHGQQRDPADRRVLDVLRRRARRARRARPAPLVNAIEELVARSCSRSPAT